MRLHNVCYYWLIGSLLTACTVGPNYVKPPIKVPHAFKEKKGNAFVKGNRIHWKVASPQDRKKGSEWWTIFHDSQLNQLEHTLNSHNQTIMQAIANYQQSCAIVSEARSAYFPTLTGAFNILRQRSGGGSAAFLSSSSGTTSSGTAATGTISTPSTNTSYSSFVNANWVPDIWGLVQRTVEADLAAAQANWALIAATRLSAQGALAQYYFELRALDTDQTLLDATVVAYRKTLQLTRNQYAAGVVSDAAVAQAQLELKTAQGQALQNGILRGQYEHAIAVLMGELPEQFSIPSKPLTATPPPIPVIVPSIWLERRPDIAEAERRMKQANAEIGVAIAAFFPTINLSGSGSIAGHSLDQLITHPAIGWALGLQATALIYDGGLREATVRAATAAYRAQVAAYRQTILTAFQNVEDNLIANRLLKKQAIVERQAADDAQKILLITLNEYHAGTVAYSSVLSAQIAAFAAEKTAADTVGLEMSAAVGLMMSLGGGWNMG